MKKAAPKVKLDWAGMIEWRQFAVGALAGATYVEPIPTAAEAAEWAAYVADQMMRQANARRAK